MMAIPLAKPYFGSEEEQAIVACLRSGWVSQGPISAQFEVAFAQFLGTKFARAVNSGTSAIHAALLACDVRAGDEVVVPAFTCVAAIRPVMMIGAIPIPVDIELHSFGIDPSALERAITTRTKAIIVAHMFGMSASIEPIVEISARCGISLIEDVALSLGAKFDGQYIGTFGRASCFSFHARKMITTGEGGMVATQCPQLATRISQIRNYGTTVEAWRRHTADVSELPRYTEVGHNYKLTDIQSAIGIAQLEKLPDIIVKRRSLAEGYRSALASIRYLTMPATRDRYDDVNQTFLCLVGNESERHSEVVRQQLMSYLYKRGIASVPAAQAMTRIPVLQQRYGWRQEDCPAAGLADSSALCLPLFPSMTLEEQRTVISAIESFDGAR